MINCNFYRLTVFLLDAFAVEAQWLEHALRQCDLGSFPGSMLFVNWVFCFSILL